MDDLATHLAVFPSQSPPALVGKAMTHRVALEQGDSGTSIGSQTDCNCVVKLASSVADPMSNCQASWVGGSN